MQYRKNNSLLKETFIREVERGFFKKTIFNYLDILMLILSESVMF